MTGHVVAQALGHTSYEGVTVKHYVRPDALAAGRTQQVLRVLEGGR